MSQPKRQDVLRQVIAGMNMPAEERATWEAGFYSGLALGLFQVRTAELLVPSEDNGFLPGVAVELAKRLEAVAQRVVEVGEL